MKSPKRGKIFVIRAIDMIFEAPLRRGFITSFFLTIFQNSKSKENWIWRAPVPAIGCLNPRIGVKPEQKTGLIWETFAYSAAVSQGGKQKLRTKRRKPEVFLLQIGGTDGIRTPRLLLPGHNEKAKSDERVRRNQITNAADSSSERAVTC